MKARLADKSVAMYYASLTFILVLAFFFGGALASFTGVVIERVPKHESIMGRSHCACGRQLKWYENVPVLGWLAIGGKTRCCSTRLPIWYLLFELGAGLLCAGLAAYLLLG